MPPANVTRRRYDAKVIFNTMICREHYALRLHVLPQPAPTTTSPPKPRAESLPGAKPGGQTPWFPPTRPGQFIQLGCRPPNGALDPSILLDHECEWSPGALPPIDQPELLGRLAFIRRPFSLSGRGADEQGPWLEIIHRVVGSGTTWLAQLQAGDGVDFIGPLGNAFELPPNKSIGIMVGGGVGLPPMFYLAEALAAARWNACAFVGALTRDLLALTLTAEPDPGAQPNPCAAQFDKFAMPCAVTTNDGSAGLKGLVTAALEQKLCAMSRAQVEQAVVFVCGPTPMMHAVAKLAAAHQVDCQVCLEQAMACGMGTCQSCVARIEDPVNPQATTPQGRPWRYRLTCTDGPVFPAGQVVW